MDKLEAYQQVRLLGRGSYGEVYLVRHKATKKKYVLKKLEMHNASPEDQAMAVREAQLLSSLKHPNIVAYRESFRSADNKALYISMAFCEGGDLYTRLKAQRGVLLPEKQIVEWFIQIALALQYLHLRNILHRDLKTQNIFLTKQRIVKLGDFGIARALDSDKDMATTIIGTPYYMSPELFSNVPYNHKSDIWSLGCCVYEMATLKQAFNAKDMNSLVCKVIRGKVSRIPEQYSDRLNSLVMCMLASRPEERPTVSMMLNEPFVKRHIAAFIEEGEARATRDKAAKPLKAEKPKHKPGGPRRRRSSEPASLPTHAHHADGPQRSTSDTGKGRVNHAARKKRREAQVGRRQLSPTSDVELSSDDEGAADEDAIVKREPAEAASSSARSSTELLDAGDEESDVYSMLGVHLSNVDGAEDWIASPEPPSAATDGHLAVELAESTGVTPLRGPLVERADRLRAACIRMLGDRLYGKSHQILKTMDPEPAEEALEALLGRQLFEDCAAILNQLVLCEQSLQNINKLAAFNMRDLT